MDTQLEWQVECGNSKREAVTGECASPRRKVRRWMWIAAAVALAVLVAGVTGAYLTQAASGEPGPSGAAFVEIPAGSLSYLAASEPPDVNSQGYAAVVEALTAGALGEAGTPEAAFEELSAGNLSYLAPSETRDEYLQGYAEMVDALTAGALGEAGAPEAAFEEVPADSLFYLPTSSAQGASSREYVVWVAVLTGE